MFTIESVQMLTGMAFYGVATEAFGDRGERAVTMLLDAVKLIYQRCPPESLNGTLTVVQAMTPTPSAPLIAGLGVPKTLATVKDVGKFLLKTKAAIHSFVEVAADNTFRVLALEADIDLGDLAKNAVVYRYHGEFELIQIKDHQSAIPKLSPLLKSNFASPTLNSLEDALEYYGNFALESSCPILAKVWEGGVDGPRLVLSNKPEARMRDSLVHALNLILRDANAQPEHNTDELKPVDIKIDWFGSEASALVEVKWMGKSKAVSKNPSNEPTYTEYGLPRAQSGAKQLADYMDREVRHSKDLAPRGYLVVFDARRRNIKGAMDCLTKADAMYFEHEVLVFDPDYAKTREDFATPVRFFLNPRESFFLAV